MSPHRALPVLSPAALAVLEALDDVDDERHDAPAEGDEPIQKPRRVRHPGGPPRLLTEEEALRLTGGTLDTLHPRPRTRAECIDGERPCPYVGCRYHLFLEAEADGKVRVNFPGSEPGDLHESCALDVADQGGIALQNVGAVMNLSHERVRRLEDIALQKLSRVATLRALRES